MQVTKLEDAASTKFKAERPTEAALKNEHDYLVAESLTKKLLEKGLISQGEFDKIMARNRKTFSWLTAKVPVICIGRRQFNDISAKRKNQAAAW